MSKYTTSFFPNSLLQEYRTFGDWTSGQGDIEANLDVGSAINGVRLVGDVKIQNGSSAEITEKLRISMIERIVVTLNGTAVVDVSGQVFNQWKAFNGFNSQSLSLNDSVENNEFLENVDIPFFNNYSERSARRLTVPNTGTGAFVGRLTIRLVFKKEFTVINIKPDGTAESAVTFKINGGHINYQVAQTNRFADNDDNFLQIKSYRKNFTQIGENEISDLPKSGILTQLLVIPVEAVGPIIPNTAIFSRLKIRVDNVELYVSNNRQMKRALRASEFRNPVLKQPSLYRMLKENWSMDEKEEAYNFYDQALNGSFFDYNNNPVGINLINASSFVVQLKSEGFLTGAGTSASNADVEIIATSIVQLNG